MCKSILSSFEPPTFLLETLDSIQVENGTHLHCTEARKGRGRREEGGGIVFDLKIRYS